MQWKVTIDQKISKFSTFTCFNEKLGGLSSCSYLDTREYIIVLELKEAMFATMTFTKMFPVVKVVHLQMGNMVAFSYIKKMEGTHNKVIS